MKQSSEIINDLKQNGFDFRLTGKKAESLEILHDGIWFRVKVRREKMIIWPIIRTKLREMGYREHDLWGVRDAIIVYATSA